LWRRSTLTILLIALAWAAAPGAATSARLPGTPVPQGFVGVDLDGPPLRPDDNISLAKQFNLMVKSGVETVRVAFNWATAQPFKPGTPTPTGFVDIGGVPTNFSATDQVVALAAQRGITVLPTILYVPVWDAKTNKRGLPIPRRARPYAAYITALIKRYGPHGKFWAGKSHRRPIRAWQIWNEANLTYYWPRPFAKGYVSLLRAAHKAIKHADPKAKVVLGALTNTAWTALGHINHIRGARRLYDVISVNGFTSTPSRVITYLELVRWAANAQGEKKKPLLATELSWPSAKGKSPQHYDWNTTEKGQAKKIAALLPLLAQHRQALNLVGFDYYTWMGAEYRHAPAFNFAGLLRYTHGNVKAKPALSAYTRGVLALERCRKKGNVATRCIR
jgi:hypothetical protein